EWHSYIDRTAGSVPRRILRSHCDRVGPPGPRGWIDLRLEQHMERIEHNPVHIWTALVFLNLAAGDSDSRLNRRVAVVGDPVAESLFHKLVQRQEQNRVIHTESRNHWGRVRD